MFFDCLRGFEAACLRGIEDAEYIIFLRSIFSSQYYIQYWSMPTLRRFKCLWINVRKKRKETPRAGVGAIEEERRGVCHLEGSYPGDAQH